MNHDIISPTAKVTAHLRAETDIPLSKKIDELCDGEKVTQSIFGDEDVSWMTAMIENRYKSLSAILDREMESKGISQILELAAGILPRGILLSENSKIKYVETDLSEIIEEKKKIVSEIDPTILNRPNYSILSLNAVNSDEFLQIETMLSEGSVAVINEGLLAYLSVAEKESLARNVYALLKKNGGVWITPDLSNSGRMEKIIEVFPTAKITNQKLSESVGRDMKSNSIGGGKEGALDFYKKIGFVITEYKARDYVKSLRGLENISDTEKKEALKNILGDSSVWVLEVGK